MSPKRQRMPRFILKLLLNQPRDSNWTPSLAPELGDGPLVTGVSSTVFSCRCTTVGAACLEAEDRSGNKEMRKGVTCCTNRQARIQHPYNNGYRSPASLIVKGNLDRDANVVRARLSQGLG